MTLRVLLVYGSFTPEDRYGVESGHRVADALAGLGHVVERLHVSSKTKISSALKNGRFDVVVPVGFGTPCEDGQVFAYCRDHGIPCAGPTPYSGGMTLDKVFFAGFAANILRSRKEFRFPEAAVLGRSTRQQDFAQAVQVLLPPLIVKPVYSGSSEGISVHEDHTSALTAAYALLPSEGKVIVQELVTNVLSEVSATVVDIDGEATAMPIVELQRRGSLFMGIEEKFGSTSLDRHVIPAPLTQKMSHAIAKASVDLHRAVGARGLSRFDYIVGTNDDIYVIEANGIPGLLASSIACDAAAAAGISFEQLSGYYMASAFLERDEPYIEAAE